MHTIRRQALEIVAMYLLLTIGSPCLADEPDLYWVSSGLNNRDLTISPEGDLLFTTIMAPGNQFSVIAMSRKIRGKWQELEIAPFSGVFPDIEPMFDPTGRKLFFSSRRPTEGRSGNDWDIWMTSKTAEGWSKPRNLGEPINSAGNEFYPSVAESGNLYFTTERAGGAGAEDIWQAVYLDGKPSVAPLGKGVNTEHYEFNAFVPPDERYIIFSSQGRQGEIGRGDLYISRKDESGEFTKAQLLPGTINSADLDYCPFVHRGRLYFSSRRVRDPGIIRDYRQLSQWLESPGNGMGDIYSVSIDLEDQQ